MANALREVPRVKVISRHREECKAKDKGSNYLRCDCPKTLYWCEGGGKPRYESASTNDYQIAERRAREKETEFAAIAEGQAPKERTGKPVREAVDEYLQAKRDIGLSSKAVQKLTLLLTRLTTYCDLNGLELLPDVKLSHLEKWRSTWTAAKTTSRKLQSHLVGFFKWAHRHGYVLTNEAEKLETIKDGGTRQKQALSDAQFSIVLEALSMLKTKRRAQFRALMLLQRWTGLAILDATKLPRRALRADEGGFYQVALRREKTGVDVYATIPPEVGAEILQAGGSPYLFWDGEGTAEQAVMCWTHLYRKLAAKPAVAALKDERGEPLPFTSHILRHTFAAYCFLQGMEVPEVAKLLGHSNTKITESHYSGWIAARQARLSERMKEAYRKWQAEQKQALPLQ